MCNSCNVMRDLLKLSVKILSSEVSIYKKQDQVNIEVILGAKDPPEIIIFMTANFLQDILSSEKDRFLWQGLSLWSAFDAKIWKK